VTPLNRPSWSLFFDEFHCRGCGAQEAYQSRPRGFFERYVLPLLFLQPVRCDHCYLRSYVLRTIMVRERPRPPRKESASQPSSTANPGRNQDSRIA